MKRVLLAAVLGALALVGCGLLTHERSGMPPPENPVVSVGPGNQIEVQPDPLLFTRPGAVVITWELDSRAAAAGFRFAETGRGIRIDHEVVNGRPEQTPHVRGEFERAESQATKYRLVFRNTRPGKHTYKYTITLRDPTGADISKDPAIINDW